MDYRVVTALERLNNRLTRFALHNKLTPIVDGGVEVRPLIGFEIVEAN